MYNQPQIFSDEPFLQSEKMMAEKRPVKDAFRVIGIIVLVFILCLAFCFTSILEYYSKLKGGIKYKEANAKTEEGAKTRLEEALKGSQPLERDLYTKCNFGVLTAMWYHVNEYQTDKVVVEPTKANLNLKDEPSTDKDFMKAKEEIIKYQDETLKTQKEALAKRFMQIIGGVGEYSKEKKSEKEFIKWKAELKKKGCTDLLVIVEALKPIYPSVGPNEKGDVNGTYEIPNLALINAFRKTNRTNAKTYTPEDFINSNFSDEETEQLILDLIECVTVDADFKIDYAGSIADEGQSFDIFDSPEHSEQKQIKALINVTSGLKFKGVV